MEANCQHTADGTQKQQPEERAAATGGALYFCGYGRSYITRAVELMPNGYERS